MGRRPNTAPLHQQHTLLIAPLPRPSWSDALNQGPTHRVDVCAGQTPCLRRPCLYRCIPLAERALHNHSPLILNNCQPLAERPAMDACSLSGARVRPPPPARAPATTPRACVPACSRARWRFFARACAECQGASFSPLSQFRDFSLDANRELANTCEKLAKKNQKFS